MRGTIYAMSHVFITIKRPSHGWQSTGKPNDRIVGVIPLGAIQAVPLQDLHLIRPECPRLATGLIPRSWVSTGLILACDSLPD
jgi:hypothetical protein